MSKQQHRWSNEDEMAHEKESLFGVSIGSLDAVYVDVEFTLYHHYRVSRSSTQPSGCSRVAGLNVGEAVVIETSSGTAMQ